MKIKILFEDDALLIINKPAGLNSIADGYDLTLPHVRTLLEPEFGKLWVVHRLDKDTSGVLVLARSAAIHHNLNDQFASRQIQKQYLALVLGIFPKTLNISFPLKVNGDRRHRTVVSQETGKPAVTEVTLAEQFNDMASEVLAAPHTGYTHQIRAHLLLCGFPILGDPLYYSPESREFSAPLPIRRTALHAYSITFKHPLNGESLTFCAEIPDDFQQTIDYLKK